MPPYGRRGLDKTRFFRNAGADGTVRVWDWRTQQELAALRGHKGSVNRAAFSGDRRWVVSAGD
ncbi:MAG: WD40 repeat domain-containing protein, partial [Acidimicrobiales bacterium]